MHRKLLFVLTLGLGLFAGFGAARAEIVARVSVGKQLMVVIVNGMPRHVWAVSTARRGAKTPLGTYKPQSMHRTHYSSLFNNAPMPFSIFYDGHYAIHGTMQVAMLGRPASSGCIRLHPDNAKILFELVQKRGMRDVRIVVEG